MPNLKAPFTESEVRALTADETFHRGIAYSRSGNVATLEIRGSRLYAEVEGSEDEPYEVTVSLDNLSEHGCTCPYDWGGACKHVVAALLDYLADPEEAVVRPPLEEILNPLNREQLVDLLLDLAVSDPGLADEIESRAPAVSATPGDSAPTGNSAPAGAGGSAPVPRVAPPVVDAAAVRKEIRAALRSAERSHSGDYDGWGDPIPPDLERLLGRADSHLEANDGLGAIAILEPLADGFSEAFDDLMEMDHYGDHVADFEKRLGEAWTEALLVADLPRDERRRWAPRLAEWRSAMNQYETSDAFEMAETAAEQGWDDPLLERVLRGEPAEEGLWEEDRPTFADELVTLRLEILDRRQRHEEYLHLARADGQDARYATMLVRLDRVRESVDFGLNQMDAPGDFLALSTALFDRGDAEDALRVAEHGMDQGAGSSREKASLAAWLRDRAKERGETARALKAALIAFRGRVDLENYRAVESLAGSRWPELREEMLTLVRKPEPYLYATTQAEIFLHEGLIEDAIKIADRHSSDYSLVGTVVDAALESHPDWVFRACARQFDVIADAGKSELYDRAVLWLRRACDSYRLAGREEEFREYLRTVTAKHSRKYRLVPLLRGLMD